MRRRRLIGFALISFSGMYGADNVLTEQEKAEGWILLFDGKTLTGWYSDARATPGRGAGTRTKAAPQPDAIAQTGSNPRPCS